MGYILIIIQYLGLGLAALLQTAKRKLREAFLGAIKLKGITVWNNLNYHNGHSWTFAEERGLLRMGMDDFASRLIGDIDMIHLPNPDERINKGTAVAKIITGKHKVKLISPFSGRAAAINTALVRDPQRLSRDPYGAGWITKIELDGTEENQKGYKGDGAAKWMLRELDRLHHFLISEVGLTYADGGEISPKEIKNLEEDKWEVLIREFLNN